MYASPGKLARKARRTRRIPTTAGRFTERTEISGGSAAGLGTTINQAKPTTRSFPAPSWQVAVGVY